MVPLQEFIIQQIAVKLNGDLKYLLVFTLMRKPAMLQVWTNQYQFQITDLFYMIADNALGAVSILNKIQFKFFVIVQREIKFVLYLERIEKQSLWVSGVISRRR